MRKKTYPPTLEKIRLIAVLSELDDQKLLNLIDDSICFSLDRKEEFHAEQTKDKHCFLVSGEIELVDQEIFFESFNASDKRAQEPIFHIPIPGLKAVCRKRTEIVCIHKHLIHMVMDDLGHVLSEKSSESVGEKVSEIPLAEEESRLLTAIHHKFTSREVELPALPETAVRINRMVTAEDVELRRVAEVLQSDPVISARVISIANSAFYGHSRPVGSLNAAVIRIGLEVVRSVVMSVVLNNLFVARQPLIKKYMQAFYEHSLIIAAISHAIAKKTDGFNPEHALLAGLLHDIGIVPILILAENEKSMLDNPTLLDTTINKIHGFVGGLLLQQWGFEQDLVVTAEEADDWYRDNIEEADYCDIVLIAQLHTGLMRSKRKGMPKVYDVPAFSRLGLDVLGPEAGLAILDEAQQTVSEVVNLLNS